MRKGSIVKLTRPWERDDHFRDEYGIVEMIEQPEDQPITQNTLGVVRFEDKYGPSLKHISLEIYLHRVDVIKE